MNVLQYISELLYQHDCVVVPGFGGFIANPVSASVHPVSHSFSPPRKEILFNSSLTTNDGILAHYIAGRENISYERALHEIYNYVKEIKETLNDQKQIGITKVGTIYLDDQQNYNFRPEKETNYMLSSFGLSGFTSPAIQREGIEKRLEKAFAESKVFRSERKRQNVFAKVAIISIPAAAVFVWGFLNVTPIHDVPANYSNIISLFSGKSHHEDNINKPLSFTSKSNSSFMIEDFIDVSGKYDIFQDRKAGSVIYPAFVGNDSAINDEGNEAENSQVQTVTQCSFYIIGSCNRDVQLAENYKNHLIEKGYSTANIIEPEGKGLYKVYINCFDNEESAMAALSQIHKNENPNAWLLRK
jgi:hypothetical protein